MTALDVSSPELDPEMRAIALAAREAAGVPAQAEPAPKR